MNVNDFLDKIVSNLPALCNLDGVGRLSCVISVCLFMAVLSHSLDLIVLFGGGQAPKGPM